MTTKDTKPATTTINREQTTLPSESEIDQTVEDTFPASDPPSQGGVTKITGGKPDAGKDKGQEPHRK